MANRSYARQEIYFDSAFTNYIPQLCKIKARNNYKAVTRWGEEIK